MYESSNLEYIQELKRSVVEISTKLNALQDEFPQDFGYRNRMLQSNETFEFFEGFDSGDTAWMLISTSLVLMMTMPGLAIYYGGMVRVQNVLSISMQCLSITCLITFLWLCIGYSLAFGPVNHVPENSFIGDSSRMWLRGLDLFSSHQLAPTIPEAIFCAYQLTFAILTPALICGSIADRMRFGSMLLFICMWHIFVYCPIAHASWHPGGFLYKFKVLDFAGGNVVHISSGVSGFVASLLVGRKKTSGTKRFDPHNILLTFMGASMLWFGWFGFNAGSALRADERASMAMLTTQIATACASLSWMLTEWTYRKQPSVLGMVSGAIAGLIAITPAAGYVDQTGAFVIGVVAGPFCFAGARAKHWLGYDDALDAFGVHAIGGVLGGIMTGLFAKDNVGGTNGALFGNSEQLGIQFCGVLYSIGWSGIISFFILKFVDITLGLRVIEETENDQQDGSLQAESVNGGSNHGANSSRHGGAMNASRHGGGGGLGIGGLNSSKHGPPTSSHPGDLMRMSSNRSTRSKQGKVVVTAF